MYRIVVLLIIIMVCTFISSMVVIKSFHSANKEFFQSGGGSSSNDKYKKKYKQLKHQNKHSNRGNDRGNDNKVYNNYSYFGDILETATPSYGLYTPAYSPYDWDWNSRFGSSLIPLGRDVYTYTWPHWTYYRYDTCSNYADFRCGGNLVCGRQILNNCMVGGNNP